MELNQQHNHRQTVVARATRRLHVARAARQLLVARSSRGRRLAAAAVLATAVLSATAACTGSSSPTGLGGTSTASTSLSPTPPTTQPTGTPTATNTGSSTAPTTTSTGANAANGPNVSSNATSHAISGGTTSCTGSQIKVTLGQSSAGMSHDAEPLVFTNTSSTTCTMQGYPGAAIMSGSTVVLNATRTLNGYIGDERQLSSAPLITLAPGATASAMLESLANAGETCYPTGSGTLEVTPPNTTATTSLTSMTVGTNGICADFQVHPVVAGTFNN